MSLCSRLAISGHVFPVLTELEVLSQPSHTILLPENDTDFIEFHDNLHVCRGLVTEIGICVVLEVGLEVEFLESEWS